MAKREELRPGTLVWSYGRHGWKPALVASVGRVLAQLKFSGSTQSHPREIARLRIGVNRPSGSPEQIATGATYIPELVADAATGGRWYRGLQAYVVACAGRTVVAR